MCSTRRQWPGRAGVDAVVHLAFMIMGDAEADGRGQSGGLARPCSRRVRAAGVPRLVYTSSVAAYGFHADNPQPLTEDVPARGHRRPLLLGAEGGRWRRCLRETLRGRDTAAYVLRPCIVAGPDAQLLVDSLPYMQLSERMPAAVMRLLEGVPILKPVLPDPGVPFQLVHHDDVASAMRAAVLGRGTPGVYNIAGPGQINIRVLADELGWYSIPMPELAVDVLAELVGRIGFLPTQAQWIDSLPRAGDHGRRQGAARAALASPPQRPADAARDGHGCAHGQSRPLIAGHPGRCRRRPDRYVLLRRGRVVAERRAAGVKARARALVRALPARIALPFLALVGSLEWWLRPGRRAEAMARMRLILRGTAREGEAQPLARRSLRRSRVMLELLWRGDVSERARIEGAERLDALRAEGHGALVVHTHLCWIAPQLYALAAQGHADAIVLTIDDPPTPLQDHWQRVLTGWGVDPVAAEGSYPVVLDHLHRGHLCHIALDVPGSTACVFLDKPARLASGIAALAFASGAPLRARHAAPAGPWVARARG